MQVDVGVWNRKVVFYPPYPIAKVQDILKFQPPGYFFMPQFQNRGFDKDGNPTGWDGYICFLKRDSCPTGCFFEFQKEFAKSRIKFEIDDYRVKPPFHSRKEIKHIYDRLEKAGKPARRHQEACVDSMIESSTGGGIVLAATGTGKTITAGLYFARLKSSAVFIVDELTLLEQGRKALEFVLGEEVGVVGGGKFNPRRITVSTIQTIRIRARKGDFKKWLQSIDVFVIDELHVQMARRNFDILEKVAQPKAVFGLTATLEMGKHDIRIKASALCGPVIFKYSLEEGTRDGHLTPGLICAVAHENKGYPRQVDGDLEYYDRIVRNRFRNNIIVGLTLEAIRQGKPTVVLVDKIKHLKILHERLESVPHEAIWGERKKKDRIAAKESFDAGTIKLLIASRVFAKGVDIEKIAVILDATGTANANAAGQRFGRGTRLSASKRGLLYFDVFDATPDGERFETRLHEDSRERWRAYGRLRIPRVKVKWNKNPKRIFAFATAELQKVLSGQEKTL